MVTSRKSTAAFLYCTIILYCICGCDDRASYDAGCNDDDDGGGVHHGKKRTMHEE